MSDTNTTTNINNEHPVFGGIRFADVFGGVRVAQDFGGVRVALVFGGVRVAHICGGVRVPQVAQELLTIPVNLSTSSVVSGVRVAHFFVFCVVFCRSFCLLFFFWPLHYPCFFCLQLLKGSKYYCRNRLWLSMLESD
jgi:hypothetical protein